MAKVIPSHKYHSPDDFLEVMRFHEIHGLAEMEVGDVLVFENCDTRSEEYLKTHNWFHRNGKRVRGKTLHGNLYVTRLA